jgi:flagellar biosynthesis protein FlhF
MIDAPGLEPDDEQGRASLERLLRAAAPTEVHLVVPATGKPGDVLAAVATTSGLGVTDLLWTKLDATSTHGTVLSATLESGLPLSYFGTGRDVPDDIRPATPRELARLVLGKED